MLSSFVAVPDLGDRDSGEKTAFPGSCLSPTDAPERAPGLSGGSLPAHSPRSRPLWGLLTNGRCPNGLTSSLLSCLLVSALSVIPSPPTPTPVFPGTLQTHSPRPTPGPPRPGATHLCRGLGLRKMFPGATSAQCSVSLALPHNTRGHVVTLGVTKE